MKKNYTYTKIKRTSTLSNILSKIIPKKRSSIEDKTEWKN